MSCNVRRGRLWSLRSVSVFTDRWGDGVLQILIADDHPLVRKALRDLLEAHEGWRVCGEAGDGREVVALAETLKPDIAVLDLLMPELNGVEAARRIRGVSPGTAVLLLAGLYSEQAEQECASAGARGFVLKSSSEGRIVEAVEALVRGGTCFVHDPGRTTHATVRHPSLPANLTSRELEIAQLLAEGKSNWCIGTILGISVRTVETHRANLMRKLGLESVVELVHYALRNNLVQPLPTLAQAVTPPIRTGEGGR